MKLRQNETDYKALFWVLNLADGKNSLLDISNRSGIRFGIIKEAADALVDKGLLREIR